MWPYGKSKIVDDLTEFYFAFILNQIIKGLLFRNRA